MQKVTAILVDDEEFARIDLIEELAAYPNVEILAQCQNGQEGLEAIHRLRPDLIFVDIEMPLMTGFEMLGKLQYDPVILFCTGFAQHAVEGYQYEPTDFLLKPVKTKRFQAAMERAFRDMEQKNFGERLNRQRQQAGYHLIQYRDLHGEDRKVCLWPPDILFIQPQENNANYLEYHCHGGEMHLVKKPLKKALDELAEQGFIQVHKSVVVNQKKIRGLEGHDTLVLEGGQRLPVSRQNRKWVKELLQSL